MIQVKTYYKEHELVVEETTEGCFEETLREATRAIDSVLEVKQGSSKKVTLPKLVVSTALVDEVHHRIVQETGNDWLAKGIVRVILKETEKLFGEGYQQ